MKRVLLAVSIGIVVLALAPKTASADMCSGTYEEIVDCLNEKLEYVEVTTDDDGNPLVVVTGANVRIANASSGDGTGNLIVGNGHTWTGSTNGFVAGRYNTITGVSPVVSGGQLNVADGNYSSVSGGYDNRASGLYATVSGGRGNTVLGN